RFVPDALARGAAAVVVPAGRGGPFGGAGGGGVAVIRVPDTWAALYDLARLVLATVDPLVVGVTGSNGKTSTKEFAAAALGARRRLGRRGLPAGWERVPLHGARGGGPAPAGRPPHGRQRAGRAGGGRLCGRAPRRGGAGPGGSHRRPAPGRAPGAGRLHRRRR